MVDGEIVTIVKRYLAGLPERGIHARSAVLFGSFARGQANEESDIDLVVIAPEFDEKYSMGLVRELWRATIAADIRIEPIPCGEREWQSGEGRPLLDIAREEGLIIAA